MKLILPCLAFADAPTTEQAVRFYVELFRDVFGRAEELGRSMFSQAEIDTVQRVHGLSPDQLPGPAGAVKTIRFHLNGMELLALNGGGYFGKFHESFSLYVNCETQAQIDRLRDLVVAGNDMQMRDPAFMAELGRKGIKVLLAGSGLDALRRLWRFR